MVQENEIVTLINFHWKIIKSKNILTPYKNILLVLGKNTERVGFEPTDEITRQTISNRSLSTTQPPLLKNI